MTCLHQTIPPGKDTGRRICALGLYGGKPYVGNCIACIAKGENTKQFTAALFERADYSHPKHRNPISGCCDRADQN